MQRKSHHNQITKKVSKKVRGKMMHCTQGNNDTKMADFSSETMKARHNLKWRNKNKLATNNSVSRKTSFKTKIHFKNKGEI